MSCSGAKRIFLGMAALLFLLAASGCATVRHAVPPQYSTQAQIPGMPEIRTFPDTPRTPLKESLLISLSEEGPGDYPAGADGIRHYPVLAISGGGLNGAYGAGLLKGWSESGTRPVFKIVTGVSTGAIIAPFAFLGKDYDWHIEKLYTEDSANNVMRPKDPLSILMGDSLANSRPLARLITSWADDGLLAAIAKEHKKGRRLYVGTANMDAQKLVIWDMGAIAQRGDKKLFSKVILASASIPVMFPPVYFHVEANGKLYDEMHVDGGTVNEVFYVYDLFKNMSNEVKPTGFDPAKNKLRLYVIRNGYMSANWQSVKDNIPSISTRAIDTLANAQADGDVMRLWTFTTDKGGEFNLAYIPPDFVPDAKGPFDRREMDKLFQRGYEDARNGYPWHREPPAAVGIIGVSK